MGDEYSSLRESISQGIPDQLPQHPGHDDTVDHAPDRRQVLNSKEKKLALKNALRYFSKDMHHTLAPSHSNIDSDEVLYYVDGDFMSRNHVNEGYISLHPAGIPHGPHPGAMERSIGKKKTDELAVMVDTFAPLKLTQLAIDLSDGKYHKSWAE